MEDKPMHRRCSACENYKAFYLKGASAFFRERTGYCEQKKTAVMAKDCCEMLKYRRTENKEVSVEFLDTVITEVEQLKDFFSNLNM